jgi:hypothetical protein
VSKRSSRRRRRERERAEKEQARRREEQLARDNQNQQANKNPQNDARETAADDGKDKLNPSKSNKTVVVLEFIGSAVLGLLSRMALSTGSHALGIWLGLLSLACLGAGFATTMTTTFPPKRVWNLYWILLALSTVGFGLWAHAPRKSSVTRLPDYIRGTRVTLSQMDKRFPFGWYIFYWDDRGIMRWEPGPGNTLIMNWGEMTISPDFTSNVVNFTFLDLAWHKVQNGQTQFVSGVLGVTINQQVPMEENRFVPLGFNFPGNEPALYLGTLNADQRTPIFAIGFRIRGPAKSSAATPVRGSAILACPWTEHEAPPPRALLSARQP